MILPGDCLLSEKQILTHCSFMDIFEKKNFPILTDAKTSSHYLREIQLNFVWCLHWGLFISVTITDWSNGIYIFYNCHIYRDWACAVDGKGVPLYNCFNFVDRTIARNCRPVWNKRAHHTKVHGIEFQSAVLPNGLIINLERQWQVWRHDCVLSGLLNPFNWFARSDN